MMKRFQHGVGSVAILFILIVFCLLAWVGRGRGPDNAEAHKQTRAAVAQYGGAHKQTQRVVLVGAQGASFFAGLPVHPQLAHGQRPVIGERPTCSSQRGSLSRVVSKVGKFLALTTTVNAQTCTYCMTESFEDNQCGAYCPAVGWFNQKSAQSYCDGTRNLSGEYGCGFCDVLQYTDCTCTGC